MHRTGRGKAGDRGRGFGLVDHVYVS
jgi:hypothetical protein